MFKQSLCLAFVFFLVIAWGQVTDGQSPPAGPNPAPSIDPDEGSLLSTAASSEGNLNCWISRNSERALAVYVYTEDNQLKANFRQYLFSEESYASTQTKIILNGTTPTELANQSVIPVKLISVSSPKFPHLYKMVFTSSTGGTSTDHDIGYMNFIRGNKQRPSSKVSIKLAFSSSPTTGIKVTPGGHPCDEPPIDDVGEEEEIAKSLTINNAPTNFVLPIATP